LQLLWKPTAPSETLAVRAGAGVYLHDASDWILETSSFPDEEALLNDAPKKSYTLPPR
jgi:hypothetical protein